MLMSSGIAAALKAMAGRAEDIRETLNDADRYLGDGDTGMTVAQVIHACVGLGDLPEDLGAALGSLARAVEDASGSTLASATAIGLRAAGHAAVGKTSLPCTEVSLLLAAAATSISERSGAAPGDKTMLDALVAVEEALARSDLSDSDCRARAADAAAAALVTFRDRPCRAGRARLQAQRSVGRDDPGMLAFALLLRATLATGRASA